MKLTIETMEKQLERLAEAYHFEKDRYDQLKNNGFNVEDNAKRCNHIINLHNTVANYIEQCS